MGSNHFSYFADVEKLRRLSFPLLFQFLSPYRDYFCDKHGLRWTDNPGKFPYRQLVGILASPDAEMPDMLRSGLFFINGLSNTEGTKYLAEALRQDGLLPDSPLSCRDCVIYGWLVSPGLMQEQHAIEAANTSQETECFFCAKQSHPDLSRERIIALEDAVNSWLDPPKGYGYQLVYHCRNRAVGFHFRYGELGHGDSNSLYENR